jgi:WD40 repeat protein
VVAVAASPDGKTLASAAGDGLRIWDAQTGQERANVPNKTPDALAFTSDGRLLAGAGLSSAVVFWDAATGREVGSVRDPEVGLRTMALSSKGDRLAASVGDDYYLQRSTVWELPSCRQMLNLPASGMLAFSPDGATLAVGTHSGAIRLFETASGKELQDRGHGEVVYRLAWRPGGKELISVSNDRTTRRWDAATGKELGRAAHDGSFVVLSADGGRAGFFERKGGLAIQDTLNGQVLMRFTPPGSRGGFGTFCFSPDGNMLATSSGGRVHFWNAYTGAALGVFDAGSRNYVSGVTFSGDAKLFAGTCDKEVRIWTCATGAVAKTLEPAARDPGKPFFSPDGRYLVCTAMGEAPEVFEVATGKSVGTLGRFAQSNVAFTPDSARVALGTWDGAVELWDLPGCKRLARRSGHRGRVVSLAFSPDGKRLASGGMDTSILVWDLAEVEKLAKGKDPEPGVADPGEVEKPPPVSRPPPAGPPTGPTKPTGPDDDF